MGCLSTREKYKKEIIKLSGKPEEEIRTMIEQILISTEFEEKDIYLLFKKFLKLNPNENGLISNNQLLEFPEFKFSPFRNHLLRVFHLKENNTQEFKSLEVDKNNKEIINNLNNINDEEFRISQDDKLNLNNNFLGSFDKKEKKETKNNSYIHIPVFVESQHINFKNFCEFMKVFHYKCDVEEKIKCKFNNYKLLIVYFDLYDVDGDGKISKKDLKGFLKIINSKDENDTLETTGEKDDLENLFEPIINLIFQEFNLGLNKQSIDFKEYRKLMWHTKIDRSCVIYLEE